MKTEAISLRRTTRAGVSLLGAATLIAMNVAPGVHARSLAAPPVAPKYGGTFQAQVVGQPDCLDPQKTGLSASNAIFSLVVDSLISFDKKGHYQPDLALKWKYSNGGKTLTLFLRHGVKFSNGDPFNASAVKYTFDRALNPATKSTTTAADLKTVTSTTAVNAYTVRLNLSAPSRVLLTNLTLSYTGILDPKVTRAEGSGSCQRPVGTGPFKIQGVGPAFATVTLVRNDYHNFNPAWINNRGKPYLSKVVFKAITNPATAVSELLSGDLDYASIPGTQLSRVQGNSNVKLHRALTQGETFVGFNFSHPQMAQTPVRKAIAEAINTQAILTVAYQGLGKVANSPLGQTMPFYDKNASKYALKYNPTDAQRLFAANHVTGPFDLVILQDPAFESTAQVIQQQLGAVGVKINIVTKAPADYFPAVATGKFDLTVLGFGYPDPDILFQLFHSSQQHGGLNFWNYSNPTVDNLLTVGRENAKKARAAYNSVQKIFDTEAVDIPLINPSTPFGLRSRIKGYDYNPSTGIPYVGLYL